MAAQYEGEQIPAIQNSDLYFEVENGRHDFCIRQLFDPRDDSHTIDGLVHFEVVVKNETSRNTKQVDKIHWMTH